MGHFTTGVSVLQDLLVNLLGTLAALGYAITGTVKISGLEIFISSCFVGFLTCPCEKSDFVLVRSLDF